MDPLEHGTVHLRLNRPRSTIKSFGRKEIGYRLLCSEICLWEARGGGNGDGDG